MLLTLARTKAQICKPKRRAFALPRRTSRLTILCGALILSTALPAAASARPGCGKLYTVRMGERTANAVYAGTRKVTPRQLRLLGRIEKCQRHPAMRSVVRAYDHRQAALHQDRLIHSQESFAVASWYDDAGSTASGWHAYYGVANRGMAFGTRVTFYYGGREVTAVVDDRGPYVAGRDWDLNQNTAAALGFSGVDAIGYTVR